jgi:hypothetical protein
MEKVFTDDSGRERRVVAPTQEELDEAVKSVKGMSKPTYPNINVPVAKGHDLVEVQDDLSMKLVDGTGAHNSPNNAVDPFNPKTDKAVPVAGLDEPAEKTQGDPGNVRPNTDEEADKNVKANTTSADTTSDSKAASQNNAVTDEKSADSDKKSDDSSTAKTADPSAPKA